MIISKNPVHTRWYTWSLRNDLRALHSPKNVCDFQPLFCFIGLKCPGTLLSLLWWKSENTRGWNTKCVYVYFNRGFLQRGSTQRDTGISERRWRTVKCKDYIGELRLFVLASSDLFCMHSLPQELKHNKCFAYVFIRFLDSQERLFSSPTLQVINVLDAKSYSSTTK